MLFDSVVKIIVYRYEFMSDLEASCDGSILVVGCLRVSNEVIPASEQLPAKDKVTLLCPITSFIGISCHPMTY